MLIEETEHWRFTLIPEYRRKPYKKVYEKRQCYHCYGLSVPSLFSLDREDCFSCNNTGELDVDVTPKPPEKPEIPQDYIDHMRKAHNEYIRNQAARIASGNI